MILYQGLSNMAAARTNPNTNSNDSAAPGDPQFSSVSSSNSNSNAQMILCWPQQQQPNSEDASRSANQPAILQQAVINANNYFGILPPFSAPSLSSTSVMNSSSNVPQHAPSYATSGVSLQQHNPAITSSLYQEAAATSSSSEAYTYGGMQHAHLMPAATVNQAPAPSSNSSVAMMGNMQPTSQVVDAKTQQFSFPFAFDSATTNNLLQLSLQDPNMLANLMLWKALQDANASGNVQEQGQQQIQQQQIQQQHQVQQQQQTQQQQMQPQQTQRLQAQQQQHQVAQQQQQAQQRQQQQQQQQAQQLHQQQMQQLQLQQQQIQQQLLQSYSLATGSQATRSEPQSMTQNSESTRQTQSHLALSNTFQTGSGNSSAVSSHAFHPYGGSSTAQASVVPFQTLSAAQSTHQQINPSQISSMAATTATSNAGQHSDRQDTNSSKKLFALQTFVKPVSREGNNDSPLNDDLWRLFTGDYDEDSPDETPSSEPVVSKTGPSYSTPTLAPSVPMGSSASSAVLTTIGANAVETSVEAIPSLQSWQPPQQSLHPPTPPSSSTSRPFLSAKQQEAAANDQYMMVPPTLFPPTLLGSNTHPSTRTSPSPIGSSSSRKAAPAKASSSAKVKAVAGGRYRKDGKASSTSSTPFDHLKNILAERGFSFPKTKSSEAGYVTTPSPLQLASFGTKLVKAVHASDPQLLSSLLECGLSPNPCNQFRDSILDLVCKRANEPIFQCLLEHNADLQVCDGFGRTPLHHAAWASTFSPVIAHAILTRDPSQAFLEDNRGQTPLEYVRPSLIPQWIAFLDEHKDEFWPMGGDANKLTSSPPRRRDLQLADPPNALSVDLAGLVSSGVVEPAQVEAMDELTRRTYQLEQFQ
jgi:hypothetical protein